MGNFKSHHKYFLFIFLCLATNSFGQDMKAVNRNIKKLCSKPFYGRGYTFDSDKKTANFIADEFKAIGISTFPGNSSYFQKYNLKVNTFPSTVILKINGKKLRLGHDYLPASDAGSGTTTNASFYFIEDEVFDNDETLKTFLKADLSGKVVIYDEEHERKRFSWNRAIMEKILQAEASIVLYDDKLTFSIAKWQMPKPRFYLLRKNLPDVANTISFEVESRYFENYTSQNVIGYIKGTNNPEKFIILSAHYDHLGSIGKKCYFPGANDNASGVSMLIEIAKYYKKNPPNFSIVFIGFGSEEAGLIGSKYYVEHPYFPLKEISFVINLDLFGSGEEGMMAVNGSIYKEQFELLEKINIKKGYLSKISQRGKAANSDHYFFSENDVPSFFFYLMGKSWTHYHNIYDAPPLPLSGFKGAYQLIIDFSNALQNEIK